MKGITIGNRTLSKYFSVLKNLSNDTKRRLIKMLDDSITNDKIVKTDFKMLFGAWSDERDADKIIEDLNDSRMNKKEPESL